MIQMNEIEYTDFIQFQETETFSNGVASTKQNVQLYFDERVDLESSLVIYDGLNVDLMNDASIQIQKEGISELIYILKDIDGYPLEEGKKEIILDTTSPVIDFKYHEESISDQLFLDCDDFIHIDIQDENLEEYHVYVNEEEILTEDSSLELSIDKDIKSIFVTCKDVAGNITEKRLNIHYVEYPIIDDFETKYLCANETMLSIGKYEENFNLEVYCDGIYIHSIQIENEEFIPLHFDKSGIYTFKLKHLQNEKFEKEIKGQIIYSNKNPLIQLITSHTYTNQDVNVEVKYDCDYLSSGFIDVVYDGIYERYPLMKSVYLPKRVSADILYEVYASIIDQFGRTAMAKTQVRIDNKAPVSSLYIDANIYTEPLEISEMPNYSFHIDDTNSNMTIQYYLNEEIKNESFETIFKNMKREDVLKILTTTKDALNNTEIKEYQFIYKPKPISIVTNHVTQKNDDRIEHERTWSISESNELKLDDKVQIEDETKPQIHYVREKDVVHVWIDQNDSYSKDSFVSIQVNGKEVDLSKVQKDKLNNDSIDISLKSKVNDIVIKAKDENGNETVLKKSEVKEWSIVSIATLLGIVCILIYVLFHRLKW